MAKLTDVAGIGPTAVKVLAEHNIKTVEALASISLAELQKISGFGGAIRARAVKKSASDCLHKAAKQPTAPIKSVQATVKKPVIEKPVVSRALNQVANSVPKTGFSIQRKHYTAGTQVAAHHFLNAGR